MSRRTNKKTDYSVIPDHTDDSQGFDEEDYPDTDDIDILDQDDFGDDDNDDDEDTSIDPVNTSADNFQFANDNSASMPSDSFDDDIEFSSEELALSLKYIVSDSAGVINKKIQKAPLSVGCKKAFTGVVGVFFSRDVYLAYVSNPEKPKLNLQIELEHVVLSSSVDDVNQSEYHQIKQLITDSWSFILSRARDGMERQLQMQKRIEQRSGEALSFKNTEAPKPAEKSIKSLFFKR